MIKSLAIFCGSNSGNKPVYAELALKLADAIINADLALIYGGAKVGLMGIIANHVLEKKGRVIGVMPKSLVDVEIAHEHLTEFHVVNTMHERKALIEKLADGFILLPGGPGSLDEFFEMYTWGQLGYHTKPCGILNVDGYYDSLFQFLDHVVAEGFLKLTHRDMILVDHDPNSLLQKIFQYRAPVDKKWIK